jgi:chromosome segregation ATPase
MGKLGELRYEARAATQRARRAERALRDKEQELEELKAKCASLARERSALSARLSERAPANNAGVHKNPFGASGASHGSSAFAPRTTNAGVERKTPKSPFSTTPRKPSGESLSLSSRWNQWEMEARRGDKRLAMLMRGYKEIEGELQAARESARVARESVAFSEDELEATRSALEELRGNFEAAKELLNEGLEARDALEQRVRSESRKNAAISPELESLRAKNAQLEADAEASREKTSELLRRTVQRDRKIDALSKKLAAAAEAAAASEKAREKAEEEATRVDEQCRALRRRVATREAEAKVQKSSAGEEEARRAAREAPRGKREARRRARHQGRGVQHARVDGLLDQGRVAKDAIHVRDGHRGLRGRVSPEGGAVSARRGETPATAVDAYGNRNNGTRHTNARLR